MAFFKILLACFFLSLTQFAGAIQAESLKNFLIEYNASEEKAIGWQRLPYAIEKEYEEIAEYFVLKGDQVNSYKETWDSEITPPWANSYQNSYTKHPLLTAIRKGYVNVIRAMVKSGKDFLRAEEYKEILVMINPKFYKEIKILNKKALLIAIEESPASYEIVAALLDAGVNVNEEYEYACDLKLKPLNWNYEKTTPLKAAIAAKKLDVAKLLIQYGADVEQLSPLQKAVVDNNLEAIQLLLQSGADPLKALDIAMQKGYNESADALLQAAVK